MSTSSNNSSATSSSATSATSPAAGHGDLPAAPSANASSAASHSAVQEEQRREEPRRTPVSDVKRPASAPTNPNVKSETNPSAVAAGTKEANDLKSNPPDLKGRVCENGPCKEPTPKPLPPLPPRKFCKDEPCPPCPPGQMSGKDGSCVSPPNPPARAPEATAPQETAPQTCPAGQVWTGSGCVGAGAQECPPGQTKVGISCQADCFSTNASSQNLIVELRSARLEKSDVCGEKPNSQECREAEASYDIRLNEYRSFLAGAPAECRAALPDPSSI